jgi:hypothetical protein
MRSIPRLNHWEPPSVDPFTLKVRCISPSTNFFTFVSSPDLRTFSERGRVIFTDDSLSFHIRSSPKTFLFQAWHAALPSVRAGLQYRGEARRVAVTFTKQFTPFPQFAITPTAFIALPGLHATFGLRSRHESPNQTISGEVKCSYKGEVFTSQGSLEYCRGYFSAMLRTGTPWVGRLRYVTPRLYSSAFVTFAGEWGFAGLFWLNSRWAILGSGDFPPARLGRLPGHFLGVARNFRRAQAGLRVNLHERQAAIKVKCDVPRKLGMASALVGYDFRQRWWKVGISMEIRPDFTPPTLPDAHDRVYWQLPLVV